MEKEVSIKISKLKCGGTFYETEMNKKLTDNCRPNGILKCMSVRK
jgi:hypothetical protein